MDAVMLCPKCNKTVRVDRYGARVEYHDCRTPAGEPKPARPSPVDHPAHYGGGDNPFEAIKVIEAWGLGFCLGNAVKYISRAGRKPGADLAEDLEKARWYLDREIARLRAAATAPTPVE